MDAPAKNKPSVFKNVWEQPKQNTLGVVGMGVTGRAVAQLWLAHHGRNLVLVDADPNAQHKAPHVFERSQWVVGATPEDALLSCDAVVLSPGVAANLSFIQAARAKGIAVFGELELVALLASSSRVVAVTGTNGKSTTTSLIGALLKHLGDTRFVGGNLGDPISRWLMQTEPRPEAVLELSSYQIDGAESFRPHVAVVLNVTPDHLDRYGSFEAYQQSKARLVRAVGPDGFAVLNADDPATRAMAPVCAGQVLWFSKNALPEGQSGLFVDDDGRACAQGVVAGQIPLMKLRHAQLLGDHNRLNALAALLGVWAATQPRVLGQHELHKAYHAFEALPHRLKPVGEFRGVLFVNDSKATNDDAAATAILAMDRPQVVLLGGVDKGGGYLAVARALAQKTVRAIIIYGAAREILKKALLERHDVVEAEDMLNATQKAAAMAQSGDVVLLAPACSSFDAFVDYRHRGEVFEAWVQKYHEDIDP